MNRKLKIVAILLLCVITGYGLGSFTYLLRFPGEIRLTEFTTHRLSIGLPLSATFHETAAVTKINDTPLSEIGAVRLGRPLTIQTSSQGTAEMTIGAFGVPFRRITLDVVPEVEIIPLGHAIGVRINTDGVMVLGTGSFAGEGGETHRPADNLLRGGDLILKANGTDINNKEELSEYVAESTGEIIFLVRRDETEMEIPITPETAATDDVRRIGAWVRDSTKGIGTLTFYNPETGEFGALGHGILDVDTKMLLSVRSGNIMPSTVTSVNRGARGNPGELEGTVNTNISMGSIATNCESGIFGTLEPSVREDFAELPRFPIARRTQIEEGPATVLTNVSGTCVRHYEIEIEHINQNAADETKGIVIRITDPELLRQTGGIVQGMSGSPIIQNDRIIGAITHVFVQDPTKGYAIFIESMIRYCPQTQELYV
ncbi:MAG: SpoIVB peptidase [Defluviitaleaceae bacterium]|nr:SpoIVB peptidase [Defluviitaleaceae bacterium]MCL2224951.1 SpoIVB peptidase [Defluviitaleaceae bacterium]MCL2262488.1 SpoIVB peptidase [Defluviitaleaceae bacterium]